jgi:dipeptidyl-peptidase-4
LYVYDIIKNTTTPITQDGVTNHIINGNCDWVYEEEFSFSKAYEWSPDGEWIAFYKFDESNVKEFTMQYYKEGNNYPDNYTFKYPKAGEDNSVVNIYTYHIASKTTQKMDVGSETDQYIPRIKWASEQDLCIFRMNRHQNHLELLYAHPQSGQTKQVYEEHNAYYIDIHDNIYFLQKGKKIVLTSEKEGYNHLYMHDVVSKKTKAITTGAWDIDNLVSVDEKQSKAYFTAGITSPLERQFYAVNLQGGRLQKIISETGWNTVSASGSKYFLVKHQSTQKVPTFRLLNTKGKTVRLLEQNETLQQNMSTLQLGKLHFLTIPNDVGDLLHTYMITPPNFDSTRQYPVLMYQYSGPGSQQVGNKFQLDSYMWHQFLAQRGYIIVVADGTGTGGRGETFKKKTYLQLGKLESDDQIAVAQHLGKLSFVDANRIGIWGWSYGGFMSSTCLFKAPKVFKAAIAVAPVTNWRFYDNIYTERYMRTPQENPEGYDHNAPEKLAKNLEGNFLLIHGLADDNVHFQNAAALTNQLIKHNKQFRSEYYPNGNHGIGGGKTRLQLYQRMTDFVLESL